MAREIQEPKENERGREVHPAWAMIGASRVSSQPGAVLFDSEIRHQHYVTVRLSTASRKRDLNRDWLSPDQQIVDIAMSEAQWASFISSMNQGSGVPCTMQWREGEGYLPDMPYAPRLQESMDEVRNAANEAVAKVAEAFKEVEEAFESGAGKKALREKIRTLHFAVAHMPANAEFAAQSLTEHAENVVQKAKVDIEAMVTSQAERLGIDPGDLITSLPQLGSGDE